MKKLFSVVLMVLTFQVSDAWSRNIASIPHTENFDAASSLDDLKLENGGGTVTWVESGCYSGGCAKIMPPTDDQNVVGLGGWGLPENQSRINIRFLVKIGPTYESTAVATIATRQNKFIIMTREDDDSRQMVMFEDGSYHFEGFTWGICEDGTNACHYPPNMSGWYPQNDTPFQSQNWWDQWVCVEYEHDVTTDVYKLFLWTLDQTFNGEYSTLSVPGASLLFKAIQVIGGHFSGYHESDPNNYIMIDNIVISNTTIGPPAGFLNANSHRGVSISGGVSIR